MSDRAARARFSLDSMAGGAFGDIVCEMQREGHVPSAHLASAYKLLRDMRAAHGASAGIVPLYGERVQASLRSRERPPGGGDPDAFARMRRVLDGLSEHERALLGWLIVSKELPRGSLSDLGRMHSGYKTARTTRAYAVGRIASLLASIHELAWPMD